jgi:adenosylhomocysteine nucleosidase
MNQSAIGLIGAMQEEVALIIEQLVQRQTTIKAGIEFHEGLFLQKKVVVCKSGVGKVNAAVCTQILIDTFEVQSIIFTGVAGALHPDLNIGDIVISADCMQHDMDVTALGFPKGIIPFDEVSIFKADLNLQELAFNSSTKLFNGKTMQGRILSGDQFIASRDKVKQLFEDMEGTCTEMEGAAVAQVCSMNTLPFVIIRSMSDKADGSAHMNFAEFTTLASRHSFMIVEEMVKHL